MGELCLLYINLQMERTSNTNKIILDISLAITSLHVHLHFYDTSSLQSTCLAQVKQSFNLNKTGIKVMTLKKQYIYTL